MNIGFIGTGNMGTILIESLINGKAVKQEQLFITNRTLEKAYNIQKRYPNIHVMPTNEEVVKHATIVFICTKPLHMPDVLKQLRPHLTDHHCIVSITSPISVQQLESLVPCSVARVIPSITNRALAGSTLITVSERCTEADRTTIEHLFRSISRPIYIDEPITRIASDLTSCGPAFFSYLIQKFIDAAVQQTSITKEQATTLTTHMIIGLGALLEQQLYTLPTLQEKVCVKGGITGAGIEVLEKEVGDLFVHLFQKTHEKFYEETEKVRQQIDNIRD
ncbi:MULTISPECIES: late competence protein ComER [Anoxybacillus]|uniref:Pyrroline-5-carboxylate reductase n=1 Tax=Anoxybacillus flavithermus TaxID=33934 RepID=A0AAX2A1E2_9BACL|nr:late competence protein ComER [Anoxybacillus flavithermus]ASA95402.1 late competence protein ComER [Anoxybacillus flavithermus]MBE2907459.1 late competence protein ComER [Anoxybacillus flavithermus]MBE2909954.1 late competence protein ComER [Anoxybacillus flavithermus]MBE2915704.1 late competence protein ComER [Anoxybacillus flavithermus]MBE2917845.1 late competence protein ComER [Anoxybacillus flavithermus]